MSDQVSHNHKLKVLHVVGSMTAGGIETLIMNFYRNMDRNKIQFDFAVQTDEKCFYDDEIIQKGGKIISHPKPNENILKFVRILRNTIRKHGPYDAIHSHVLFFSGIVLEIAKKEGIPVRIAHSHTSRYSSTSYFRKLYISFMRKKILKNATNLLACSKEASLLLYGDKVSKSEKILILPNAIDLSSFEKVNKNKNYLIKELKISKESILIGHVGRFSKAKNHPFIIKLFSSFLKSNQNAHLVLIGDGEDKEKTKDIVLEKKIEDNVHFLGVRKDIEKILSSLDLFLFPSLYEGLGIALIEAQAAGLPCVVSNAIPVEADLNVGLIKRVDLLDSKKKWIQAIYEMMAIEIPSWEERKKALKLNGYDIIVATKKLHKIYTGELVNEI